MKATYPTIYRDGHGEEHTVIENDGQTLRMVVRGVEFISAPFGSFDSLTPTAQEETSLAGFTLDSYRALVAATLIFEVPMPFVVDGKKVPSTLTVQIDLEGAGPREEAARNWADPRITLSVDDNQYASAGGWGCFEMELLRIQQQLPSDAYMECCFNCAFSGYNPAGNGLWGMFCHRDHKEEYVQANNKPDWFRLNRDAAEYVQEIYLCPEFQRWNGETGYRDGLFVNRLSVTENRAGSPDPPAAEHPAATNQTEKI